MNDEHAEEHHILSVATYLSVFGALMVLTFVTWAVAFVNLSWMNNFVMLGIAVFKGFLVISLFMHLKYNAKILWVVAAGSFVWLTIMLSLTLSDVLSRNWETMRPESWL